MEELLVSVIIPTYNRVNYLGETLDSVISQTYSNWECIVVDDSSEDHTEELMEFYTTRDKRIRFMSLPPDKKGAAACRNFGLKIAEGSFLQFLDSDDILDNNKLVAQLEQVKDNFTVFFSKWGYFSESDYRKFKNFQHSYKSFKDPIRLLYKFGRYDEFLPLHSYLIPVVVANLAGPWNELLGNNDDAEYMTRIFLNCKKLVFVPDAKVYYRVEGQNSLSSLETEEQAISAVHSLKLIQGHLEKDHPRICKAYMHCTRKIVLQKITRFPNVIKQYEDFFNPQVFSGLKNRTK